MTTTQTRQRRGTELVFQEVCLARGQRERARSTGDHGGARLEADAAVTAKCAAQIELSGKAHAATVTGAVELTNSGGCRHASLHSSIHRERKGAPRSAIRAETRRLIRTICPAAVATRFASSPRPQWLPPGPSSDPDRPPESDGILPRNPARRATHGRFLMYHQYNTARSSLQRRALRDVQLGGRRAARAPMAPPLRSGVGIETVSVSSGCPCRTSTRRWRTSRPPAGRRRAASRRGRRHSRGFV
jgi:hypothetical protein